MQTGQELQATRERNIAEREARWRSKVLEQLQGRKQVLQRRSSNRDERILQSRTLRQQQEQMSAAERTERQVENARREERRLESETAREEARRLRGLEMAQSIQEMQSLEAQRMDNFRAQQRGERERVEALHGDRERRRLQEAILDQQRERNIAIAEGERRDRARQWYAQWADQQIRGEGSTDIERLSEMQRKITRQREALSLGRTPAERELMSRRTAKIQQRERLRQLRELDHLKTLRARTEYLGTTSSP